MLDAAYDFTGYADHGVSEALYLNDPDNNGVELYFDRPKYDCKYNPDGSIVTYTEALDLHDLLRQLD